MTAVDDTARSTAPDADPAAAAQRREADPPPVVVDLLVIGAGPAGLYAAYYAGFRGLSVAVLDSLPEPGGQVSALYPEKAILDVAGFPRVKGQDLVDALVAQAASASPRYLLGERAEDLVATPDAVRVTTHTGLVVQAGAVVITGGIGTFTPRPLPAADGWAGRGLRFFVPRLDELAGADVLVVGGGDSALDWVASLAGVARSLTLVHRRAEFRAHPASVAALHESPARVLVPYEVAEVHGDDHVAGVSVRHRDTGEVERLTVNEVVAALGFVADLGPLARWGLVQDKRHIVVDTTMATNLPRVFAAGDIVEYPGKARLIATGFGEAATAVNNAAVAIDPHAHVFPGHSSEPA